MGAPVWSRQRRTAPRDRCPRQIHRSTKGLPHAHRSIAISTRPFRVDAAVAGRPLRRAGCGVMAVCSWCHGEMETAISCVVDAFHRNGRRFDMSPFGGEPGRRASGDRCGDCGVIRGGWHHPGCDLQGCPVCGGQLMSCGCRFDEDGFETSHPNVEPLGVDGNGLLTERMWLGEHEVVIHRDDVAETDITSVDGIRCTTALRTVIDLAPEVTGSHLEDMVRDCLERGLFTVEEAWRRLAEPDMVGRRGAELLRQALPPSAA
jgi:hypothetical protein